MSSLFQNVTPDSGFRDQLERELIAQQQLLHTQPRWRAWLIASTALSLATMVLIVAFTLTRGPQISVSDRNDDTQIISFQSFEAELIGLDRDIDSDQDLNSAIEFANL